MRINTNLEKEVNLPPIQAHLESVETLSNITELVDCSDLDKISAALPQVMGLDSTDQELDDLAKLAIAAHTDLMDLSMRVEERFCGEIVSAASSMLGHAINARTNKIKKKLDMIGLQIKKQVADAKTKVEKEEILDPTTTTLDRNELIQHLTKSLQNESKD